MPRARFTVPIACQGVADDDGQRLHYQRDLPVHTTQLASMLEETNGTGAMRAYGIERFSSS
jgi:hypothetical protein